MNSKIVPFVSATETLKNLLINRVFSASYCDRRYIDAISEYRDILQIDNDDNEFRDILQMTTRNLNHTLLITFMEQQNNGFLLYTNINHLQFGDHWFQIIDLYSYDSKIILVVKQLRQYKKKEDRNIIDWDKLYNEFANILNQDFFSTVRYCIQFLVVTLVTIVTVMIRAIPYISEFSLKFLRELSNLITALTPVVIRLIDALCSIVDGFYKIIVSLIASDTPQRNRRSHHNSHNVRQAGSSYPPRDEF